MARNQLQTLLCPEQQFRRTVTNRNDRLIWCCQQEKPRAKRGFSLVPLVPRSLPYYCRFVINCSRADLGGRTIDSGSVPSGWSTRLSRSVKVGFCVFT